GDHRGGAAVRLAAVGGDHHRERVLAARAGLDADRRDQGAQLPRGPGNRPRDRGDLRDGQPCGRPGLRAGRPEDPADMSPPRQRLSPSAWIGLVMLAVYVVAGIAGPLIAPYDLSLSRVELAHQFERSSAAHWLGTDASGRDALSQLLWGARSAL